MKNTIPKGFLSAYRKARKNETEYFPLAAGFLRLEYASEEEPSLLRRVCFVEDSSEYSEPLGKLLELSLSVGHDSQEDIATFIGENDVSGLQWSRGAVQWGHTFEEDSAPSDQRIIPLDEWVDECIQMTIKGASSNQCGGALYFNNESKKPCRRPSGFCKKGSVAGGILGPCFAGRGQQPVFIP